MKRLKRGNASTKLMVVFLVFLAYSVFTNGMAESLNEIDWDIPSHPTNEQMDYMEEVGRRLFLDVHNRWWEYREQLPPDDAIHLYYLTDHMNDLHIDDEWEAFEAVLKGCSSAEDMVTILHTPFIGITQPRKGHFTIDEVKLAAEDILYNKKLDYLTAHIVVIPKTSYDPYGMAWQVWACSEDNSRRMEMWLTRGNTLLHLLD